MSHSGRHNAPNSAPKRHVWQCNMAHPAMQYGTQDRENKPVQQCHLRKFRPCHATNVTTGKRASAENPWNTKPPNDFQGISVCLDFKKTRPRRRRRSPQPKTKKQRRRIVTQRRTDTNRHLCIRPWPRATAAPGIQQPRKEKPTEFSFQLNHSSRRTSYS